MTHQQVLADAAIHGVVADIATQLVVAVLAEDEVVAAAGVELVLACPAIHLVVAARGKEGVVAAIGVDEVAVGIERRQVVGAIGPVDHIDWGHQEIPFIRRARDGAAWNPGCAPPASLIRQLPSADKFNEFATSLTNSH